MSRIALIGKKYNDRLYYLDSFEEGETNNCASYKEKNGGAYNFLEPNLDKIEFVPYLKGEKLASIISNKSQSMRTAIVRGIEPAIYDKDDTRSINLSNNWAHFCYTDDIENYETLLDLEIPCSVDFCTTKDRSEYLNIISKADIVFDSRERKGLYKNLNFKGFLILHDQNGIQVIKDKGIVHQSTTNAIPGLNVNGAGDIYAANFLKNYLIEKNTLTKSATLAMMQATYFLMKRGETENEKEI